MAVQGPNSDAVYRLDVDVSTLATTLATDLATLFTDIAKDLGGKDKEDGKPKPIVPPGGKPVAKLDLSNLSPSERHYAS